MHQGNVGALVMVAMLLGLGACSLGPAPPMADLGKTEIAHSATIQADPETLNQILATFNRADDALRRQDLDTLMSLYAKNHMATGCRRQVFDSSSCNLFIFASNSDGRKAEPF